MTPLLQVEGLCVKIATRRDSLVAVDDVSFSLQPSEILGVVGESGAGKSIMGTAVLGLLEPPARQTAGRILLVGRRIDNLAEGEMRRLRGRQIGAVFQDPLTSLDPLMTIGRQLVETILTHFDIPRAEAHDRALRLLAEVGIPARERLDSYPHELSGGMRQRVVLALAFACEPRLIIADEPTTALDVSVQAQVMEMIRRMCRERGTAVMLITHDMGVIAESADRIAVMYAGRIVEIGAAEAVLRAPAHPYSRGLVASIPSLWRRSEDLPQIPGAMPRPGSLPSGCSFHPRCAHAMPVCSAARPALLPATQSEAACWLVEDNAAVAARRMSERR
jgi:peptide/nickel transport system ATP-binding protein